MIQSSVCVTFEHLSRVRDYEKTDHCYFPASYFIYGFHPIEKGEWHSKR